MVSFDPQKYDHKGLLPTIVQVDEITNPLCPGSQHINDEMMELLESFQSRYSVGVTTVANLYLDLSAQSKSRTCLSSRKRVGFLETSSPSLSLTVATVALVLVWLRILEGRAPSGLHSPFERLLLKDMARSRSSVRSYSSSVHLLTSK